MSTGELAIAMAGSQRDAAERAVLATAIMILGPREPPSLYASCFP